jgi:hypothetical protein
MPVVHARRCHGNGGGPHVEAIASPDVADLVCPPPVSTGRDPQAVWLYLRFMLSYRDVEDLLAERGLEVPYETVRR